MKKIILFVGLLCSVAISAQCNISGKSSINVLAEETYTIATETAQCKDCHQWVNIGGNTTIIGDKKQNSFKVKANTAGREVISLSVLTPTGILQCSKSIDIVDTNSSKPLATNGTTATAEIAEVEKPKNCDIEVTNYKEVKYNEQTVSFFPDVMNDAQKYSWVANYENGDTKKSTDKVALFPYSKENGITKLVLKVNSSKCLKEYSKNYDANYWRLF